MKSKVKYNPPYFLKKINVRFNSLSVEYCSIPDNIETIFCTEDNSKNFPPDGHLLKSELDSFFYIYLGKKIVGFYRVIDLFFDNSFELHGSFNSKGSLISRSYFQLTKLFIKEIYSQKLNRDITSMVQKDNIGAIQLLIYLNFKKIESNIFEPNFLKYKLCHLN